MLESDHKQPRARISRRDKEVTTFGQRYNKFPDTYWLKRGIRFERVGLSLLTSNTECSEHQPKLVVLLISSPSVHQSFQWWKLPQLRWTQWSSTDFTSSTHKSTSVDSRLTYTCKYTISQANSLATDPIQAGHHLASDGSMRNQRQQRLHQQRNMSSQVAHLANLRHGQGSAATNKGKTPLSVKLQGAALPQLEIISIIAKYKPDQTNDKEWEIGYHV